MLKKNGVDKERFFGVHSTSNMEGVVWNCVKDHIIDEKEDCKTIGLRGFDYKLFEEEEVRGTRGVIRI